MKKPEMRTYYYSAVTSEMRMINGAIRTATSEEALITDEQLERETERIFAEYEPYWKPCIILTVGN